jgi:hypothetical protein
MADQLVPFQRWMTARDPPAQTSPGAAAQTVRRYPSVPLGTADQRCPSQCRAVPRLAHRPDVVAGGARERSSTCCPCGTGFSPAPVIEGTDGGAVARFLPDGPDDPSAGGVGPSEGEARPSPWGRTPSGGLTSEPAPASASAAGSSAWAASLLPTGDPAEPAHEAARPPSSTPTSTPPSRRMRADRTEARANAPAGRGPDLPGPEPPRIVVLDARDPVWRCPCC